MGISYIILMTYIQNAQAVGTFIATIGVLFILLLIILSIISGQDIPNPKPHKVNDDVN